MPESTVRTDLHQTLDVDRHFLPKVTFDPIVFLDQLSNLRGFFVVQVAYYSTLVDARVLEDLARQRTPDAKICR